MLSGVPFGVYECSDGGWISIGSLGRFFANLCKTMGRGLHPRSGMPPGARISVRYTGAVQVEAARRVVRMLSQTDICAGPIYSLEERSTTRNRARQFVEVDHPTLGRWRSSASARSSRDAGSFRSFSQRRASTRTTCRHRSARAPAIGGLRERVVGCR
jgi:crotonobetainyl-CoA:carnitine CoA-transferase CaiB-like acyl-CoA transferase